MLIGTGIRALKLGVAAVAGCSKPRAKRGNTYLGPIQRRLMIKKQGCQSVESCR